MRLAALAVVAALAFTTSGEGRARVLKGDGPTTIAVGFGSAWIGMGSGEVVRLDARRGRETARLPALPMAYVHGLALARGAVWVLRGGLTELDPRTGRTRDVEGFGSATAFAIAAGAGALWVADDGANTVVRIDPARARRAAVIRIPGRAFGVAARGRQVLVVSVPRSGPATGPSGRRFLRRIDPRTNRLSPPLAELDCDPGIAVGRAAVWTTDPCAGWLVRRDPATLRPTGRVRVPRWHIPVLGFGSVWLVGGKQLLRIDPGTLVVQSSIRVRGDAAAAGEHGIWVLSWRDGVRGSVTRVDPWTDRVVGRSITIVPRP
jgi:streptogramin lyase